MWVCGFEVHFSISCIVEKMDLFFFFINRQCGYDIHTYIVIRYTRKGDLILERHPISCLILLPSPSSSSSLSYLPFLVLRFRLHLLLKAGDPLLLLPISLSLRLTIMGAIWGNFYPCQLLQRQLYHDAAVF